MSALRPIAFVVCASVILFGSRLPAQEALVRKAGAEAIELAKAGKFSDAESRLRDVAKELPKEARRERSILLFHLGWIKSQEGASGGPDAAAARDAAVRAYEGVLEETPGNAQAVQNLALALDAAGKKEQARGVLERSVARSDPDPTLGVMLMDRYVAAGRLDLGWRLGEQMAMEAPGDYRVHERLRLCRGGTGDFAGYVRQLWKTGPATEAGKGALALYLDAWRTDPKLAADALVIWVDALVQQGDFTAARLAQLRGATPADEEIRKGIEELSTLVSVPAAKLDGDLPLGWWRETFDRQHAASGVLRVRGDAAARARQPKEAEAFYLAARRLAPPAKAHLDSPRKDERMASLQAMSALARLYHRFKAEVDEGGRKLDQLISHIFQQKMVMYEEENVAGMRQFHETLSVIFYDEGRWNDAVFQVSRTVSTEAQLAQAGKRDPTPLPHLERMKAESLVKLDRFDEAAESVTAASKAFIQIQQPEQVAPTLRVIDSGKDKISEPRKQEIDLLRRFSSVTDKLYDDDDQEKQIQKIREVEKLIPADAPAGGAGSLDRKWLGTAVWSLASRAEQQARTQGKADARARLLEEKKKIRTAFPDLKGDDGPKRGRVNPPDRVPK